MGLGKGQEKANEAYYAAKGQGIYSDFLTYAGSEKIAYCNAKEFYPHLERKGKAVVFEFGVGDGRFAREFLLKLREICKQKGREGLFAKLEYVLHDISPKMLEAAGENLKEFGGMVRFEEFDAVKDSIEGMADYIRINELLSDLPAEVYVQDGKGNVRKVEFGEKGKIIGLKNAQGGEREIAEAVLSHFPVGYYVPLNYSAGEFLLKASEALERKGYMDIFDYGFAAPQDLLPADMWNASIVREYGGQVTVDLNFPYLSAIVKSGGFESQVELQKGYVERILGEKLYSVEKKDGLEYVTEKEMKKKGRGELENYEEDDGFYHMRVRK